MVRVSIAFDSRISEEQVRGDLQAAGFTNVTGPNCQIFEADTESPDEAKAVLARSEAGRHMKDFLVV